MIDQKVIDVTGQNVLELGSGTGLAGLVSARAGSRLTVLTDYHPTVLNNAQLNVECNNVERTAHVAKLDWFWVLSPEELEQETGMRFSHGGDHETDEQQREYALEDRNEDPVLTSSDFRIIIAADCIFDRMHSKLVPKVAKRYLSKHPDARFYVLLPHREKFKAELKAFEENMPAEGWELVFSQWIEKSTINFRYYIWRLPQ
nr:hypothetical protein HK105_008199 [Polyrhizophydium stewartii]